MNVHVHELMKDVRPDCYTFEKLFACIFNLENKLSSAVPERFEFRKKCFSIVKNGNAFCNYGIDCTDSV